MDYSFAVLGFTLNLSILKQSSDSIRVTIQKDLLARIVEIGLT